MGSERICLTYNSADSLLEHCSVHGVELEPSGLCPLDFGADAAVAKDVLADKGDVSKGWLNLLVGRQCDRRESKHVSCRSYEGRFPPGSILHLEGGIYVVSPEFNLLLQSTELHVIKLAQLLGRYLGTFSTDADGDGLLRERPPLTSVARLTDYLRTLKGVPGVRALRAAMQYTCENAASPQEVNLQLMLSLPPACNGFALQKPKMNYAVALGESEKAFYPADVIRIDLYWPEARFGLEYQGEREHDGRMVEDVSRWYAARKKGIELWFVTKGQLQDPYAMDFIAREVARRTGKRIVSATWPTLDETQQLIDVLTGKRTLLPKETLRERRVRASKRRTVA